MTTNDIFVREGDFVRFAQSGKKLEFDNATSDQAYYAWLDARIADIGQAVRGAKIIEREGERSNPRKNSGVYYDTPDYVLLGKDMVLRTTSNPKTHAYCAFKMGENDKGVRQDHRYVFDGEEKRTIQMHPWGPDAVATVKRMLARRDIMHPGRVMEEIAGVRSEDLTPAISLVQLRQTFYVLLDGGDALRCSLDRAEVTDLRPKAGTSPRVGHFSEVEVPIFPRISPELMKDPRTWELVDYLSGSLNKEFGCKETTLSKYRRGMKSIGMF